MPALLSATLLVLCVTLHSVSAEERRYALGAIRASPEQLAKYPVVSTVIPNLPTNFIVEDKWPGSLRPVLDQGVCGGCWAFAASEVLSDRLAIQSNLTINVTLSPQELISCDTQNAGCNGGRALFAWDYMISEGFELFDSVR